MAVSLHTHSLTELSYDVATNSSVVQYLVKISTSGQSHNDNNITTTYYIDGVKYTNTHKLPSNSTTTVVNKLVTINHNPDGKRSVTASYSTPTNISAGTMTGSKTIDLTDIPRKAELTSAPNFNDEENPTINYSNAAGNAVDSLQACISLTGANADVPYRDISKTGSSYTFNLTTTERNTLRNNCTTANSRTVVFIVKTIIGSNTYYSTLTKTLSIVNANPTFSSSNISYSDINSTIVDITGNNQQIVRNNSSLRITLSSATANKGATISRYEITFNGSTQTKYSAGNIDYGTVNISSNTNAEVKVIDSRGNSVTATKSIIILDWILPSAIITLNRVNNYEDNTKLKVQTTISSVDSKNAIQSIKYRYKTTDSVNYSNYVSINNNTLYTINKDKQNAWNFQFEIKDKFGTTTYNLTLGKGVPIMYIDIKNLAVGINDYPSSNEALKLSGNMNVNGSLTNNGLSVTDVVNRLKGDSVSNGDANNYKEPSFHYMSSNTNSNVPEDWTELLTLGNGGYDVAQIGIGVANENTYTRVCNSGTWRNWKRLAYASEIPTKTSDLTNDSGFMSSIPSGYLKETVLYNNATGSNGDISLNDSVANYTYIEIYFKDNNGREGGYIKLYNIDGKSFDINIIEAGSSNTFIRRTGYTANGTSLIVGQKGFVNMGNTNSATLGTNYIYITKVIGLS